MNREGRALDHFMTKDKLKGGSILNNDVQQTAGRETAIVEIQVKLRTKFFKSDLAYKL